jgi:hypothetical protein
MVCPQKPSVFSLQSIYLSSYEMAKLEPVSHTNGVHALSAFERQCSSGRVLAPLGITVMVGLFLPLMV